MVDWLLWPWLAFGLCCTAGGYWAGYRHGRRAMTRTVSGNLDRLLVRTSSAHFSEPVTGQ